MVPIPPYAAPLEWVERLHDPDFMSGCFREACARGKMISLRVAGLRHLPRIV